MIKPEAKARSNNRRELVLDAAAALFVKNGFNGTSTRDIAKATGMLPGSLYYHFTSKEDLLVAVFEEGVKRISNKVDSALATAQPDPWKRLQAACEAHLSMLLGGSNYASVVIKVLPSDVPGAEDTLVTLRRDYETRFITLFEALPLDPQTDRSILRLMLMGAMNHTPVWYRSGADTPAELARKFIHNLRGLPQPTGTEKTVRRNMT
jgi:AcrR family transcriptional regulator